MKITTTFFLLFFSLFTFAQDKNKIFVNAGISSFENIKSNKKNFNISISFIHQTKKERWSMEYYYLYAQNDPIPSFYYDEKALFRYIVSGNPETIFEDTKWNNIEVMEIGAKVHYSIIRNKKTNFSVNLGLGINYSEENIHRLLFIDVDLNNHIYGYGNFTALQWGVYGTVFPGIHFDYNLGQNFLLGVDGGYHLDLNEIASDAKENTTFWNYSIGIGKRF